MNTITTNRPIRIQWIPNLLPSEKRICLTRIRWEVRDDDSSRVLSNKLSVSVCWKLQDLWIGAYWSREFSEDFLWICLLPCLPIRFHWKRSLGGIFP